MSQRPIKLNRGNFSQSHRSEQRKSNGNATTQNRRRDNHVSEEKPEKQSVANKEDDNSIKYVIKVSMRKMQALDDPNNGRYYQDKWTTVAAPDWLERGLDLVREALNGDIVLDITDDNGGQMTREINGKLSLRDLQLIARNESWNTSGKIKFSYYKNISREVVFALKDLVRHCVIIGRDWTTHYGGYPKNNPRVPQRVRVYVCDLIALQFENDYNSGRLVVIGKDQPKGLLDEFIYEQVVGEKKPTFEEVAKDRTGRYHFQNDVYFDKKAYVKFVAQDVLTTGLALDQCANESVNFKFLKYGTGFYAGQFQRLLESLIGQGVAEGLTQLLPRQHRIKSIELPFYDMVPMINKICSDNNVPLKYGKDDALESTHQRYATATTNCACSHASTGNAMGFGSVDGVIGRNLRGKANKFSPILNQEMREMYLS